MSQLIKVNATTSSEITQDWQQEDFIIIELPKSPIENVNSYSISKNKKHLLLCAKDGVIIVNNQTYKYKLYLFIQPINLRYFDKQSPFWLTKLGSKAQLGVKLGCLIETRNQMVVVPNFNSNYFKQSHAYIFGNVQNYEIKSILYNVDFFLPIQNLFINEKNIYVSNRKRFIIYNYLNDFQAKNQKYYLDQYFSNEPNNRLRYFQTSCQNYEEQIKGQQIFQSSKKIDCHCGRFHISQTIPKVIAFIKVDPMDELIKVLCIYREKYGIEEDFVSFNDKSPFEFSLSADGQYIAYTSKDGTIINVYNIAQKQLHCILYAGMASRQILKMDFFKAVIQGRQTLCLGMIRRRQDSKATMHIFKIQKRTPTLTIDSQYKRYINLFESDYLRNRISEKLLGPQFYIQNNVLYLLSLCGIVQQIIDFKKGDIRQKKNIQDAHVKWSEQAYKIQE